MELDITELDYDDNFNNSFEINQYDNQLSFEEIPENNVPIKVIKKGVTFREPINQMNQSIPNSRPQISYEDILSKMGMFVSDGKLHLLENKTQVQQQQQYQNKQQQYQNQQQQYQNQQQQYQNQQIRIQQNIPPNSYIYNKYFKEEMQQTDNIRRPMTKNEYKRMLLEDILQKERIQQIKSKRLIMPTSNINIALSNSANLNKLFSFPKR